MTNSGSRATATNKPGAPRTKVAAPLQAYVLHRHDWSESSLILDVLTRERGRLVLVAKGAKRPTSQLRAILLPFQRLHLQLTQKHADAEIQVLRSAEWRGGDTLPRPAALLPAYYLNELLVLALPRQDAHARLFDAYGDTIRALDRAQDDATLAAALRTFELLLLRELGWLPELHHVTLTRQDLNPAGRYHLDVEAGVCALPERSEDEGLSGAMLLALDAALEHDDLEQLRQVCRAALAPLRPRLRAALHYHLGTRALRTRQLMVEVQGLLS